MIHRLGVFITGHPVLMILLNLIIVFAFGSGIRKVTIDENIKSMLPKDIASRKNLSELEDIYGGSDVFLIAINHEKTVFNPGTLAKVKAITDSLEAMPEIVRVSSLSTTNRIKGEEWGIEVIPFMDDAPETQDVADQIRRRVFEDSTYLDQLVSRDARWTVVIAVLDKDTEPMEIYSEVGNLAEIFEGPEQIHLSGIPVIQTIISENIKNDLRRLLPLAIAVIIVVLFLSLRTISGVILPLLAALLSTVSMVGLMGHLGKPFMVINNIMPVILVTVGISYAIHIIVEYYENLSSTDKKRDALVRALDHVGKPILLAGLTTVIGFITMLSAPLPVYAEFGAILAFGIFICTLITFTLTPSILMLLPLPRRVINRRKDGLLDRFLDWLSIAVPRRRKLILAAGIILLVLFALGIPSLELDMNPISFFPKNSPLRITDEEVNHNLGGSINLNLLFHGNAKSHEILNAMDDTQKFLEGFPEMGSTMSLATIVKKLNRKLHADDPAMEVIPKSEAAIAQAILMYTMSGSPEDFEAFVDYGYENAQVAARVKSVSTKRIAGIADAVDRYLKGNHADIGEVKTTGFVVFLKDLADLIITSQIRSLLLAILLVALVGCITFRSLLLGALSIIPIIFTVVLNFGIMGMSGIDLSIPTAVIASIIIGIGVDFSLHFLSRFQLMLKDSTGVEEAVTQAIRRVGKPILFDALPTAIGFVVLLSSGFLPVRYIGLLISMTMIVCAVGALTVLAAAVTFTKTGKEIKK